MKLPVDTFSADSFSLPLSTALPATFVGALNQPVLCGGPSSGGARPIVVGESNRRRPVQVSGGNEQTTRRRVEHVVKQRRDCARYGKAQARVGNSSKYTTQSFVDSINKEVSQSPPYLLLPEEGGCRFGRVLRKKAKCCVSFLSKELNIKPVRELPPDIECLGLRDAVRSVYPVDLSEIAELSLKTVQKLETGACTFCDGKHKERLSAWREARFQEQPVDDDHLARFKKTFGSNLPEDWNSNKYPYIPNGHATLSHTRREGGNWNSEPFADYCRPDIVISSGKPRVVTLYSEFNTRTLTPLHYSLYSVLRKRKWLLVGDPADDDIGSLNGFEYVSFDYRSATDMIKTAYVQAAVEILIERASNLSDDEIRCLEVLGKLRLEEDGEVATRGQPMGSVMSFPLLCLINKTVVDLTLEDLHTQDKITFSEWSSHRCRINGDDLLSREPVKGKSFLRDGVRQHGAAVGLVVNEEKTMVDAEKGEINSTLFVNGKKEKKVNASALFMGADVNDVLGMAVQSTKSLAGFRRIVRANANVLAKQAVKLPNEIPEVCKSICMSDAKIRRALSSVPCLRREPARNFFSMDTRPCGYDLTRVEEVRVVNERVDKVRVSAIALSKERARFRTGVTPFVRSPRAVLRHKKTAREEDTILSVLARAWQEKLKESLREESILDTGYDITVFEDMSYIDGSRSKIDSMFASIKEWKKSRGPQMRSESHGSLGGDFLSFG